MKKGLIIRASIMVLLSLCCGFIILKTGAAPYSGNDNQFNSEYQDNIGKSTMLIETINNSIKVSGQPESDDFAGKYIDSSGKLHILISVEKENMQTAINRYKQLAKDDGSVIFERANYSLKFLKRTEELLTGKISALNIDAIAIDEEHNHILIFGKKNKMQNNIESYLRGQLNITDFDFLNYSNDDSSITDL